MNMIYCLKKKKILQKIINYQKVKYKIQIQNQKKAKKRQKIKKE